MKRLLAIILTGSIVLTSINIPVMAQEAISQMEELPDSEDESLDEEIKEYENDEEESEEVISEDDVLVEASEEELASNPDESKISNPRRIDGQVVWDAVYFGNYWQNDTNGDGVADTKDDKIPIKWRVLSVSGDDIFLLADKNLDCKEYNTLETDVTWETCTLRSWLNGYDSFANVANIDYSFGNNNFIDNAFSSVEQLDIRKVDIKNYDNLLTNVSGGNNTYDKIYLLSQKEATTEAYGFSPNEDTEDEARCAKNTSFTNDKGASTYDSKLDENQKYVGNGWWWLRTPGIDSKHAQRVNNFGKVYSDGRGVDEYERVVRPAIHINLSSSLWSYAGTVTSEGKEDNKIIKNIEHWGFLNSTTSGPYTHKEYLYYLTNEDLIKLMKCSSYIEKALMELHLFYKIWNGSCFGMSVTSILFDRGELSNVLNSGVLANVEPSDKILSLINFYHMQQFLLRSLLRQDKFCKLDQKKQIQKIIDDIDKYGSVSLGYHFYGPNGKIDGHNVVAYDYSACDYNYIFSDNSVGKYGGCIYIYDCSKGYGNEEANLYYNDSYDWVIPAWEIASNDSKKAENGNCHNNAQFSGEVASSDDLDLINYSGEIRPTLKEEIDAVTIAYLAVAAPELVVKGNASYEFKDGGFFSDSDYIPVRIISDDSIEDENEENSIMTAVLPYSDGYSISFSDGGTNAIVSDNTLYSATTQAAGEMIIDNENSSITVNLEDESDCEIMLAEEEEIRTCFDSCKLICESASEISATIGETGIELKTDAEKIEIEAEKEEKTYNWEIEPSDGTTIISPNGLVYYEVGNQEYTGSQIEVNPIIADGDERIISGVDYTIQYKNNINSYTLSEGDEGFDKAKAPTIIVKGMGNYSDTETIYFKINPANLSGKGIDIADIPAVNSSTKPYTPVPKITFNKKALKAGKDFTVEYYSEEECINTVKPVSAGIYYAKITGIGNYTGNVVKSFEIGDKETKKLVSKLTINKIKDKNYTGNPIELTSAELIVKDGQQTLTRDTHYKAYITNNTEVGTATVKIVGIGEYIGSKTATFKINGIALSNVTMSGFVPSFIYDGTAKTQDKVELSYSETRVDAGIEVEIIEAGEYSGLSDIEKQNVGAIVSYTNNINAGTATMILTGVNNYTGTIKKTYKINQYDIAAKTDDSFTVALDAENYEYSKDGVKPAPTVKFKGNLLIEGKDYTVAYANNTVITNLDANTVKYPTVKITGKGNFRGSDSSATFIITGKNIASSTSGVKIVAPDKVYADKAGNWKSNISVTDNGKKLSVPKDYVRDVVYTYDSIPEGAKVYDSSGRNKVEVSREARNPVGEKDIVPSGTVIRVKITGAGGMYIGSKETTYRIISKDISKVKVSVSDKIYSGKAITLNEEEFKFYDGIKPIDGVTFEIDEESYVNNVNKGKASVTIRGTGNYGGTKTVTFNIGAKKFLWWWR